MKTYVKALAGSCLVLALAAPTAAQHSSPHVEYQTANHRGSLDAKQR